MKPTARLGPWPLGIDNVSERGSLQTNDKGYTIALADAMNVDIDRAGKPRRRRGRSLVASMPGIDRARSSKNGAMAQVGNRLVTLPDLQPLAMLNSTDPCSYTDINDSVIVSNRTTLLEVRSGIARPLGVPDAGAPSAQAIAQGGLDAGRYTLAVAFLRDRVEGGLSVLKSVQVEAGGGIRLFNLPTAPGAGALRLYRSAPGGGTLYRVEDVPIGLPDIVLGSGNLFRAAETQNLRQMMPGSRVAAWRGRLLVAHGRSLRVSESMRPHLSDPRGGIVPFAERIVMVATVEAGVFVGTRSGVVLLRGNQPSEWVMEATGAAPPLEGDAATVDGGDLSPDLQLGGQQCALWLSTRGFALGTEQGQVVEVQADRMRLRADSASLCTHDRRVTAAVR